MVTVISLGGSIVAPDGVDINFLIDFSKLIQELLEEDKERRFILIVGGGAPARVYQKAYREICIEGICNDEADWIGIMATRLNAQLVKAVFSKWCPHEVVYDPTRPPPFEGKVLVAAGWKPGFSTDYDAVLLAEHFGAETLINLSNIEKVYTADPKTDPSARPLDKISWPDFRALTGDEWVPGKNIPFDPVASRHCEKINLKVICAAGRNLENFKNIILGGEFTGTVIGG